jgi:hypothetical protein
MKEKIEKKETSNLDKQQKEKNKVEEIKKTKEKEYKKKLNNILLQKLRQKNK